MKKVNLVDYALWSCVLSCLALALMKDPAVLMAGSFGYHPGIKPTPVKIEPVKIEPVKPTPVKPEAVKAEPVRPEPVKPEAVKPEPIKPENK